jgi:hypothetical protein
MGCDMAKMAAGNFAWNRVFSISQLFCLFFFFFLNFSEIYVFRSDQLSLLMYRCLLPSSVTIKMNYEENMENARYATNDDTPLWTKDWIILCCIKNVNVYRIMSLNTSNKNVNIIWHYCIISQIKLHGFWKRSISSHKYEERCIEVYDK